MRQNLQNYPVNPERNKLSWGGTVFFSFVAGLSLIAFLGVPSLHNGEAACAEAIQHYLLAGNSTLDTSECGVLYGYLAAFFSWQSGVMNEFYLRITSALAALVFLFGTILIGRKICNSTVAMSGAWMLLSCVAFLKFGRSARPEMLSAALVTVGLVVYLYSHEKPTFGNFLLFYLTVAFGIVTRDWVAAGLIVLAVLPFLRVRGSWRRQLSFGHLAAFVLVSGFLFTWFYYHGEASQVSDLWQKVLPRELGFSPLSEMNYEPLIIYFGDILRINLPWTPLLLISMLGPIGLWRQSADEVRALGISLVLCLGFLLILPINRYGYLLSLTGIFMLLGANGVVGRVRSEYCAFLATGVMGWIIVCCSIILTVTLPLEFYWPKVFGFKLPWVLAVFFPLMGIGALLLMLFNRYNNGRVLSAFTGISPRLAGMVLAGALISGGISAVLLPALDQFRTQKPFLERLGKQMGRSSGVIFWGEEEPEPRVVFYLGPKVSIIGAKTDEELKQKIDSMAGKDIFLLSYNDLSRLETLADALHGCGINLQLGDPEYREMPQVFEHPDNRKLVAWKIHQEQQ